MIGVFAFWTALFLPGFALLRRSDPLALADGGPATIARSYLATFVVLTPVSVACYVLQLPLAVFSTWVVLSVLASAAWLVRERFYELAHELPRPHWPPRLTGLPKLARPELLAAIGFSVLAADLVFGARAGSHLGGDAGFHVARARMLVDHGFQNWDPLVPGHRFESIYHTNLYHALLAAAAQLCRVHPGVVWEATWPWAKLVSACAAYHLASSVFRDRGLAWAAAIGACLFVAPYSVLPYPNTIAPYWILSMGIAFGVDALVTRDSLRPALWLGATALVIAEIHMLNALFLGVIVAPPLVAMLAWQLVRKRPGARQLTAALLALGLSLPWLLAPVWPRIQATLHAAHATPSAVPVAPAAASTPTATVIPAANSGSATATASTTASVPLDHHFLDLGHGQIMGDPAQIFGITGRYTHLVVLLLLASLLTRRPRIWAISSIVGMACAALFFPPLCTLLVHVAREAWILWRITLVLIIAGFAVTPGTLLYLLLPLAQRSAALARAMPYACCAAAAAYAVWAGVDGAPWSRANYMKQIGHYGAAYRAGVIEETSAIFSKQVRRGETIAAPLEADYTVVMHCDCFVFAVARDRGSRGLLYTEMVARRAAMTELYGSQTTPSRKLAILREHKLSAAFTQNFAQYRRLTRGLVDRIASVERSHSQRLIRFDLARPEPAAVSGSAPTAAP